LDDPREEKSDGKTVHDAWMHVQGGPHGELEQEDTICNRNGTREVSKPVFNTMIGTDFFKNLREFKNGTAYN